MKNSMSDCSFYIDSEEEGNEEKGSKIIEVGKDSEFSGSEAKHRRQQQISPVLTTPNGLKVTGNECCERLAYYGMSSNLVIYFKQHLHQTSAKAAESNSNWSGICYFTPLLRAFLADAYLGRHMTIASFSIICHCKFPLPSVSARRLTRLPITHVLLSVSSHEN